MTVVVPAKDEAAAIEATLRSLARQDYGPLQVVAVDDRSTDGTGARMDAMAAEFPGRVRALHVDTLPAGWAGKVHAMTRGAEGATQRVPAVHRRRHLLSTGRPAARADRRGAHRRRPLCVPADAAGARLGRGHDAGGVPRAGRPCRCARGRCRTRAPGEMPWV